MSTKKNNHTLLKVTMAAAGIGAAVAYGKARAAEKRRKGIRQYPPMKTGRPEKTISIL